MPGLGRSFSVPNRVIFVSSRSVWFQAITATLLISAAPFFILFFIPLDNTAEKEWLLKIVLRLVWTSLSLLVLLNGWLSCV